MSQQLNLSPHAASVWTGPSFDFGKPVPTQVAEIQRSLSPNYEAAFGNKTLKDLRAIQEQGVQSQLGTVYGGDPNSTALYNMWGDYHTRPQGLASLEYDYGLGGIYQQAFVNPVQQELTRRINEAQQSSTSSYSRRSLYDLFRNAMTQYQSSPLYARRRSYGRGQSWWFG